MDIASAAAWAVALIAIGGLIFNAGRLSERVTHQEEWRLEHIKIHETQDSQRRSDLEKIYEKIDNIWGLKFERGEQHRRSEGG